ncbi:MAG: nucleotide exchange factor GrpE [Sphaerochaetaceae bacterium]|jgi:molecular chaperone GrpE
MSKKSKPLEEEAEKTNEIPSDQESQIREEAVQEGEVVAPEDDKAKVAELEAQIESLKKAADEAKDQVLRTHADLDNTRKRLVREKEESVKYASERLVKDLITSLDNLDYAIEAAQKTNDIQALLEGVKLVRAQFYGTLEKNGLKTIESVGHEFNPSEHEAVMMSEEDGVESEVVTLELSKGYMLYDRVLRPAKVKIAKPRV